MSGTIKFLDRVWGRPFFRNQLEPQNGEVKVNYPNKMQQIPSVITFGSCLSRYTTMEYGKLFGAKIISSVYHNRSDLFVGKFLEKTLPIVRIEEFEDQISTIKKGKKTVNPDRQPNKILQNQYEETIGLHRLSRGIPLFQALKEEKIDLIIMDNYMDIAARMAVSLENPDMQIFFNLRDSISATLAEKWTLGEILPPEEGVKNMKKIVNFFHSSAPNAKIIFLNFPHNTYSDSPDRVKRTKEYESLFKVEDVFSVKCLEVPEVYQTSDKMHFKEPQYSAYAGIVYQYYSGTA